MSGLPYGLQSMLKEGHKHYSGLEEAVYKNIDACRNMAQIARTSLGPNGMNKMVINHLDKLFVTNDASTIVTELDVNHPAAKLLVMAAKAQETEMGDGTNLVLSLAGELVSNAEQLLRDGLHTADVVEGYQKASEKALEALEQQVITGTQDIDIRNKEAVTQRIKGVIASKQHGYEDILSPLVAEACINVCPQNAQNFNVDNVRIVRLVGGGLADSKVVKGMLLKRDTEGSIQHIQDAKVAVYSQGIDTSSTETKGTVLITSAEELQNYSRSEENKIEEYIKSIADAGVKLVVSGSSIGEMAMHFIEKYGMMALRIPSKFDLRRFCKATGAVALVKISAPQPDEIGFAKSVRVAEIGGVHCVVLEQDAALGSISSIVLRGSTENFLENVETAIVDGINAYKALCKEGRMVPAGGATEIEIARKVMDFGKKQTGLDQYSIAKYGEAFEVVPRTLAENSGLNISDYLSSLYTAHAAGQTNAGVDIDGGPPKDLAQEGVMDLFLTKWWAIKLATDAVITVLKVDQIIMAKQAGGPKPRSGPGDDE